MQNQENQENQDQVNLGLSPRTTSDNLRRSTQLTVHGQSGKHGLHVIVGKKQDRGQWRQKPREMELTVMDPMKNLSGAPVDLAELTVNGDPGLPGLDVPEPVEGGEHTDIG